ncbi:unnamed protein product [Calicophoron daubneyi]
MMDPAPLAFAADTLSRRPKNFPQSLGRCTITSEGRCYTAKDITVGHLPLYNEFNDYGFDYSKSERTSRHLLFRERHEGTNLSDAVTNIDSEKIDPERFIHVKYGCISSSQKITACNSHLAKHLVPKTIACCNSSDYCNAQLVPKFVHHASNEEAFKTALRNQRLFRQQQVPDERVHLNPGLNLGPDLLNGGELLYENTGTKNSFIQTSSNSPNLFHMILIIAFSSVALILLVTLTAVCCLYKYRLHKQHRNIYEAVLWQPAARPPFCSRERCPGSAQQPASLISSWQSCAKVSRSGSGAKRHQLGQKLPVSGCSSQTMSTNLTRNLEGLSDEQVPDSTKTCSSGLMQQTVSRQISLEKMLGRGCFSDVWLGNWRGEPILAKIFMPNNRLSQSIWRRTALLHRSMPLRHQTIQGLMAVDWLRYPNEANRLGITKAIGQTVFGPLSLHAMLISEFHQWGTLKDLMARTRWKSYSVRGDRTGEAVERIFLLVRTSEDSHKSILTTTDELMLKILLRMAITLTQGLCFLHSEFAGTRGKPALAHRNLKPSNVFVRSDWSCCIGDIGLAVRSPPSSPPSQIEELRQLYDQYLDHVKISLPPSHPSYSYIRTRLSPGSTDDRINLPERKIAHTLAELGFQKNDLTGHQESHLQSAANSRLTVEKAESLDWWPVGGMQIATPRYMAPELLNDSVDPFCFEAHQRADVYALSLILWELITWSFPQSTCTAYSNTFQPSSSSRSSADSTNLSNTRSLVNSNDSHAVYRFRQAYQVEWESLHTVPVCAVSSTYSTIDLKSSSPSHQETLMPEDMVKEPFFIQSSKMPTASAETQSSSSLTEPDLLTMRYLVCEMNARPQLPTFPSLPTLPINTFAQSMRADLDPGIEVDLSGSSTQRIELPALQSNCHAAPNACIESSSSGASSLNDTCSHSNSISGDMARHTDSTDLTTLVCLVLAHFSALLPECWVANPNTRLTALRIRKNLQRLSDQLDIHRSNPGCNSPTLIPCSAKMQANITQQSGSTIKGKT